MGKRALCRISVLLLSILKREKKCNDALDVLNSFLERQEMMRIDYIVENYLSNCLRKNDFTSECLFLTMNYKK